MDRFSPLRLSYVPETGTLAINPEEAGTVKLIFSQYLESCTIPSVKTLLNKNGIRPRLSQQWAETSVAKILRNQIYTGKVRSGEEEWTDKSLRIISDEVFQACQMQRAARKSLSPKLRELPNNYSEGSFCSHCGRHCQDDMQYCPGCGVKIQ